MAAFSTPTDGSGPSQVHPSLRELLWHDKYSNNTALHGKARQQWRLRLGPVALSHPAKRAAASEPPHIPHFTSA